MLGHGSVCERRTGGGASMSPLVTTAHRGYLVHQFIMPPIVARYVCRIGIALNFAIVLGRTIAPAQTLVTNTYTTTAEDFANPERGFYFHTETRAGAPSSVPANLANLRVNGSRDPNNAYIAKISLVLRVFY